MLTTKEPGTTGNRWLQLTACVITMIMVANFQYAFTLFTPGMKETFAGTKYSSIALVFSLFLVFETWPVPIVGWLMDRFGTRLLMVVGAILVCIGWFVSGAIVTTVSELYIFYSVFTGLGAGIIYLAAISNAIRWFPDRRGLATGVTTAGYGGGSALTLIPVSATIHAIGWGHAMAAWGVVQAAIILILAFLMYSPPTGWSPAGWMPKISKLVAQTSEDYTWRQAVRMPEFYLLYCIHFLISFGGLMAIGNLSQIARYLHVDHAQMLGTPIVAFAATLNGIAIVLSRVFWGGISDRLGRENTMGLVFALEGIFIFLATLITGSPILFVIVFPMVFFGYGQVNSLLSSATSDIFGTRNVGVNFGLTYTAKGLAGLFSGFGAALIAEFFGGSFQVPFYVATVFDFGAAALAFFILKPKARARIAATLSRRQIVDPLAVDMPGSQANAGLR